MAEHGDIAQVPVPTEQDEQSDTHSSTGEWSELHTVIDNISDPDYVTKLHESRKSNEGFIKEFDTVLETVKAENPKAGKKESAQAIKSFFVEKLKVGENLSSQQMSTILYELKNKGDDEGVIAVFEAGMPSGLDKSAVLKEFYAVSLNKVGRLEDSIKVLDSLMTDDNARVGEIAGILGKVRKIQSEKSEGHQEKLEFMKESVAALQDGFYKTYEFYPGINLVYNQIELAKLSGDASLIEKAFNDAELVMYSAKKAGAERTADFWTTATLLESSIFAGKVTPQIVRHCLETSQHDWELGSTIKSLRNVAETIETQLASSKLNQQTSERLAEVLATIKGNDKNSGVLGTLEGNERAYIESDVTPNDAILEQGFMYGQTTTLIGGNIKFGGQLQDHIVNRFDANVAFSVIEHYGLDSISTIDEFNKVVDGIIRKQFDTAKLEDLHGDAHKVYDTQMNTLLESLGVGEELDKWLTDTRTNVMVDFLLGKGDCRQHAHAKQLLFDTWKTFKLNNLIAKLKDAHLTPEDADDNEARQQIQELLNKQMLVFDSLVESKVQMDSFYHPKHNEAGNLIVSDDFESVEDHSWNGIVTFDLDGHVESLEMADSFYQDVYGFGGKGQVVVDLENYSKEGLVVTSQSAVNSEGRAIDVPVRLTPLVYSGDRNKRNIQGHADVGAAHIRGIDLGYDVPEVAKVFSSLKIDELWKQMAK